MTQSNEKPKLIQKLGISLFVYNDNIVQDEAGMWSYNSYVFDHRPKANEVINRIVMDSYPDGEEMAIHRKGILNVNNAQFVAYTQYVEAVKVRVKAEYAKL